ncbi:MAG: hypothetical protein WC599_13795, partial [Bacteroidales bacterium]
NKSDNKGKTCRTEQKKEYLNLIQNYINLKLKNLPPQLCRCWREIFCYVLEPAGAKLQHNCICECSRWLKHTTTAVIIISYIF